MYWISNNARRFTKAARLASRPAYWPALRKRTFPAIEHEALFEALSFDTILDIGGNIGQFATVAATLNPEARIFSFEPVSKCFERLSALARDYPRIEARNYGLGSEPMTTQINVASNLGSSSLLDFGSGHEAHYPGVEMRENETIEIRTLDSLDEDVLFKGRVLAKLDIQGFELEALRGAQATLPKIDFIYLEGSFVELYVGQPLIGEIARFLDQQGFDLRAVYNVDYGAGRMPAQADFLFARRGG